MVSLTAIKSVAFFLKTQFYESQNVLLSIVLSIALYIFIPYMSLFVGPIAQSVQRMTMGRTVRGSNPVGGGRDFPHLSRPALRPTQTLYNGYRLFLGGKKRPGRDADPSPPSSAVAMKGQSYTSTPPIGCTACTEPQCLYKGAIYLIFCLCSFLYNSRV